MIYLNQLIERGAQYENCVLQPLTVTAFTNGDPVVNYDPIHLDGLLAKAVICDTLREWTLPRSNEPYYLPLPLARLWMSDDGLPLWASSVFRPVGEYAEGTVTLHKRNARMQFSDNDKLNTKSGRYMERRIPKPVIYAQRWQARCIGDLEHVRQLLEYISYIGKDRSRGFGHVARWSVEKANWQLEDIWRDGDVLIKSVPVDAGLVTDAVLAPGRIGWTPPHWKPAFHSMGWAAGTRCGEIDWFDISI